MKKQIRIREDFILRKIAGRTVVLPTSAELDLNMMITLNDTGAFLWEHLVEETDEAALVAALLGEYDVDQETAEKAVSAFVKKLRDNGFLCE